MFRQYWEDPELGEWVAQQRLEARGGTEYQQKGPPKKGPVTMTRERAALLDELDFTWKLNTVSADVVVCAWKLHVHHPAIASTGRSLKSASDPMLKAWWCTGMLDWGSLVIEFNL